MKIYKEELDNICIKNPVETEKSWNQKADIFVKIHVDMCDILTQWGYKSGVDIINSMYGMTEEDVKK